MKPKTILITNGKGGVGKTFTACEISSYLSQYCQEKQSVLAIDLDPSGDFGRRLVGKKAVSPNHSIGDYLLSPKKYRDNPTPLILPALEAWKNTLVIASRKNLGSIPNKISDDPSWGSRISGLVKVFDPFVSYVVIDSSPQLGMLHRMAILAADVILIPIDIGSPDGVLAAQTVISLIEGMQEDYEELPKKKIITFISSAHKERSKAFKIGLSKVQDELLRHFSGVIVPHRSAVSESLFDDLHSTPSRYSLSTNDRFNKAYSELTQLVISSF